MRFQEEDKGLFTFYREQAELEEEVTKKKTERRLQRQLQREERQKQKKMIIQHEKQLQQQRQLQLKKIKEKVVTERKLLYQPKYIVEKYEKKKLGDSVIVINNKKNDPINREKSKTIMKKHQAQDKKQDGFFLQNKEIPFTFGQHSLQKMMLDPRDSEEKNVAIPIRYYNRSNYEQEKKVTGYSYEKLPQLHKNRQNHSQASILKKQRSSKLQQALKSNDTEIIRQIRQNIKQQALHQQQRIKDEISYINYTYQQYQERPELQLDKQHQKLIQILHRGLKKHI